MTNLFISYRRDDSGGHAGRLSDRLIARFGADRIFMDVQDIQPGQNFKQAIEQTLDRCDCLLAVIGPRWLEIMEARQAKGEDFVRQEVGVALARGKTVIPVLVGGAKMPARSQLPDEMAAFGLCQAVEIRDNRFDEDAGRLVEFLAGGSGPATVPLLGRRVPRRVLLAATGAVAAVAIGVWLLRPAPATTVVPGQPSPESAVAAIDGEWVAELQKPGQPPFRIRLTLARAGDQVIGSVRYPTGDGPILEGRYADGQMTFRTSHVPQFETEPATIKFQARVDGDAIRLTTADANGVATGVAHRVGGGAGSPVGSPRALPSLSYGTWTLRNARDEDGKNWSNSVLQITAQEEAPDGLRLRGRFTWRLDDVLVGTEEVAGRYVERTRLLVLEGSKVEDVTNASPGRLAVGSYSAVLSPDERSLVSGHWGSTAQNEPGVAGGWEAVR